jgi:alkylation response protein AidB-like acyl-CoA dehydrogenase
MNRSAPGTAPLGDLSQPWSLERQAFRDSVLRFASDKLDDTASRRSPDGEFPAAAWAECAAFGFQGLPVPIEFGGSGADPETIALGLEALGYACRDNGFLFSLGAHMWSCELPLVRFGTETQRRRYLPALCNGSMIGVQAITEPEAGSDAFALTTTATKANRGWVLNGTKTFITNASVADLFVVFATTDRQLGFAGVCAFLVERDTPGLTVGPPISKMGLHSSPTAELTFTDVLVPGDGILGKPGAGLAVFTTSMDWERAFILAPAVGTMQFQLEECIKYAQARHQFGESIGKFQSVANRIVDMKLRVETSRLLLYEVARLKASQRSTVLESAMLKLHLSECFLQSSLDAVQIHGGAGYTSALGLERDVRDAVGSRIYSGTSEIQRGVIARRLGL